MKILLTMNLPYLPSFGGASKANRLLLEQFVRGGHEVVAVVPAVGLPGQTTSERFLQRLEGIAVTTTDTAYLFHLHGVEVHAVIEPSQLRNYLIERLEQFQPDWTLVSCEDSMQSLLGAALKTTPARVIYLVHTPTYLPFGPMAFFPSQQRTRLLEHVAAIVAVSQFVQEYIQQWSTFKAEVFYMPAYGDGPFANFGRFDQGLVMMINPCQVKGVQIFAKLARAFPTVRFGAVPTWGTTDADKQVLRACSNVSLLSPQQDFDRILEQTRLLLMPSLWPEAFGCTAIEAMARGIPVLASNVGGLVEAKLGVDYMLPVRPILQFREELDDKRLPLPVVPEQDIQQWQTVLSQLLTDQSLYMQQSLKGREASLAFIASLSIEPFEALLQRLSSHQRAIHVEASQASASFEKQKSAWLATLTPQQQSLLMQRLRQKAQQSEQPADQKMRIPTISREEILPLSFGQERLWFLEQFASVNAAYVMPVALHLRGQLNVAVLQKSLDEIVKRHEVLRTTISAAGGLLSQHILPPQGMQMFMVDVGDTADAADIVDDEIHRPFDLARGPLVRSVLIRCDREHHILLLSMHHIVSDGWSLTILLKELTVLYSCFLVGKSSSLPELPVQYADFACWQRRRMEQDEFKSQLEYWKGQCIHAPALELPTDRPRPPIQTFHGATEKFSLPLSLLEAIKELGSHERATLFMVLLAAFSVLLLRYTGQDDIIVGSLIANRAQADLEHLIGFFVNTLPLRIDISGRPTFRALVGRIREVALQAYAHQDVPFERLVEELQPERDLSRTPLVQTLFMLQNSSTEQFQLPGLSISPFHMQIDTAKFDLTLSMFEAEHGLTGLFEYNTDLFNSASIKRMIEHFHVLLDEIVRAPDRPVTDLALLTPSEWQQIVNEWGDASTTYTVKQCLHEIFEACVEYQPDAVALSYEGEVLSYRVLNERANQLAHYLCKLGVSAETRVGLYMARSIELVIGLLGILKAGGSYVPLDTAYPQERRNFILSDANVHLLLTTQDLKPEFEGQILYFDTIKLALELEETGKPVSQVCASNTAYIIYTSGSTGVPKGVAVSHHNVARLFAATEEWFHFSSQDVWTLFHSIAFDFSVWELWGALLYGGRLVVVPYWVSRSPEDFSALLQREQVTVLNQTPSAFRQMLPVDEAIRFTALRLVIFGGEALDIQSLRPWFERYGDQRPQLINMYGITETTVHVTYRPVTKEDVARGYSSIIGRQIPDLQLYVLDSFLQPVPLNVAGELYIGGAGLAQGYINQPGITAERFIPHPFSTYAGARLYKTGDVARYISSTDLEYVGRADAQVKIHGFRIELTEIEAVLCAHPAVQEGLVTVDEDSIGDKKLIAYIVASQRQPSVDDLRDFLQARLPAYMIPAIFLFLPAFPLTSHGKVDVRALPSPQANRPHLYAHSSMPRTFKEEMLAALWCQVLDLETVGIHDNFFTLGGDSIRSIRVVALAKERGLRLSVQQLFQFQTIFQLAKHIDLATTREQVVPQEHFSLISSADRQKIAAYGAYIEDAYPLARLQAGMIFHSEYKPRSAMYHVIFSVRLQATYDLPILTMALQRLVDRHAILRTAFDLSTFSEPLQLVYKNASVPLAMSDLRLMTIEEQENAVEAWFATEKLHVFDWRRPPLLRFYAHLLNDEEFQLSMSFHHAILDGWSESSLIAELIRNYAALLQNSIAPVPMPLVLTYSNFIALEQQVLHNEAFQRYWVEKLAGYQVALLPTIQEQRDQVHGHQILLPIEVSTGLIHVARSQGVPLKTVLLAAHLRVLSVIYGKTDVLTGVTTNGRLEEADGDQVLGLFLNTVPFRLNLAGGTWQDLVQATYSTELEVFPFRTYPLAQIQQQWGGVLFETAFNFVDFHIYQSINDLSNVKVANRKIFEETNLALVANFSMSSLSQVRLILAYSTSILSSEKIQLIAGYYEKVLTAIATSPTGRYETYSALSRQELERLLVDYNQAAFPQVDVCLQQLFEKQVEKSPTAIAIQYQDTQITYRQLNALANRLAHYLRTVALRPDMPVGVYLERSVEQIIGIMAVLKAGGAYVPIDVAYPEERIAFMLQDAGVTVVLTQEHLVTHLPPETSHVCLDTLGQDALPLNTTNPDLLTHPDNLAYVMYTSGSTGVPKGVMISHRGLCNYTQWACRAYDVVDGIGAPLHSTVAFDLSITSLFTPFVAGKCVVIVPEEQTIEGLVTLMEQDKDFSFVKLTPAHLQLVNQQISPDGITRTLIVGGEALSADLLHRWKSHTPQTRIINEYGPTETVVGCCVYEVDSISGPVPIGHPIDNVRLYILDQYLQPVPQGVIGDLYITGMGVARGYYARPSLTAQCFVPSPFAEVGGERMYDSGDLARYRPDGVIEYMGRKDQQVKLRGYRIELGEIEAVLLQNEYVVQAVVRLWEFSPMDRRLIAYVVVEGIAEDGNQLTARMRAHCQSYLPDYMLPSLVVPLSTLPITANGKIDRNALPIPDPTRTSEYIAPRTPTEKVLCSLMEDVLRVKNIGISNSFFELGGHSLLAVQFISRLRDVFQVDLPLRSLFESPTGSALALELQQRDNKSDEIAQAFLEFRELSAEEVREWLAE